MIWFLFAQCHPIMRSPVMDSPQQSSGHAPGDLETNWTRQQVRAQLFGRADRVTTGRYALGELLGRGGMGVVFAAHDRCSCF